MSLEFVNSWNDNILVASESTFGTSPNPVGSQAMEFVSCEMGPIELGQIRPQRDRNSGRGPTTAYVEGRVAPIPFSIETSVKSRSAIDAAPRELPLYVAAGLYTQGNASTSYTATATNDPVASTAFAGVSVRRAFGDRAAASIYEAEQGRGGIIKTLDWSGGDKEVMLKASGVFMGKYHLGYAVSVTLANGSATSVDLGTSEAAQNFGLGYYLIESEVVNVTAVDVSTHLATIVRGALSTSAVAHSAKAMLPYMPAPSVSGSPISEATASSCVLDSVTLPVLSWSVSLTTGADASPGETGSKYFTQPVFKRYDSKVKLKLQLRREGVSLLGKATRKKSPLALSLSQGSAVGGVLTFTWANMELDAFAVPDTNDGPVIVDLSLRNFGNEFTLTLT